MALSFFLYASQFIEAYITSVGGDEACVLTETANELSKLAMNYID